MGVRITDRITPEGRKFFQTLKELAELEVRVGFQKGQVSEKDGTDICDIAAWNELGTDDIPSRPFIRQSVDDNADKINTYLRTQVLSITHGKGAEDVLDKIGNYQKKLIQKKIKDGEFVPNADITVTGGWMRNKKSGKPFYVEGKKSNKPLIDTGRMRQSVNYVIQRKGEGN